MRTRWLLAACEANTLPDETRVQCLACWWSEASVRGPFRAATSLRAHGQTLRPVISRNVMQQVADPERRVRCRPRPRPAQQGDQHPPGQVLQQLVAFGTFTTSLEMRTSAALCASCLIDC